MVSVGVPGFATETRGHPRPYKRITARPALPQNSLKVSKLAAIAICSSSVCCGSPRESYWQRMSSLQAWVAEHKLTSLGAFWASAIGASLAYTRKRTPLAKPSLRLIHARMHAQALTLAVLSGAALLHYYDGKNAIDDDEKVSPTNLV